MMFDNDKIWNTFGRNKVMPCYDDQDFKEVEWNKAAIKPGTVITGAKYDQDKLLFECFMHDLAPVIKGVVQVLTFGAKKYSRSSWQSVPNAKQRYMDAFYRHMNAHHSGDHVDNESGLPHLFHAICNLMFITWFEIKENKYIYTREDK